MMLSVCLSDVCLTSVAYIGPKSKGQKVKVTGAGHIVVASRTVLYFPVLDFSSPIVEVSTECIALCNESSTI